MHRLFSDTQGKNEKKQRKTKYHRGNSLIKDRIFMQCVKREILNRKRRGGYKCQYEFKISHVSLRLCNTFVSLMSVYNVFTMDCLYILMKKHWNLQYFLSKKLKFREYRRDKSLRHLQFKGKRIYSFLKQINSKLI